jgi:hypothetical protein
VINLAQDGAQNELRNVGGQQRVHNDVVVGDPVRDKPRRSRIARTAELNPKRPTRRDEQRLRTNETTMHVAIYA